MAGPPPKATPDQHERVLALVGAGHTYSDTATEVFGDARYRGRVERAVRASKAPGTAAPTLAELVAVVTEGGADAGEHVQPESWLEQLVPLYGEMLKRRLEAGLHVKPRELIALLDLERRLESARTVER